MNIAVKNFNYPSEAGPKREEDEVKRMIHYIGDSARKISWHFYNENGIVRAKQAYEVLGAMAIAKKMGQEIDPKALVSFITEDQGHTLAILESDPVNEWQIEKQQIVKEDFVVLYDLDIAERKQIPWINGTILAFLKHRNVNLLRNLTWKDLGKRAFIPIVSMNDLRLNGATVSKALSWERTSLDFLRDFHYGVCKELLEDFPRFIVLLEADGMIVRQDEKLTIYFTPDKAEGDSGSLTDENLRNDICTDIVRQITSGEQEFSKILPRATGNQFLPDLDSLEDPESWSILNEVYGGDRLKLIEVAKRIVIHGEQEVLKAVPSCQYGTLQTVDRMEIENYRAIVNLIQNYAQGKENRPLSLSVFGFPGSGKSFGIKQIAKNLGRFETFTFNLSQFTKLSELEIAFQEIRDVSIQGEKLPLVFFDEFDSSFQGEPLGWLKNFLAPMQDGVFIEGGRERQIGRAIFVFAGGTSTSFNHFIKQDQLLFKKLKGPDFVSRLKGYLNIQGPNPVDEKDKAYLIRRAMLLRSMICRNARQLLDNEHRVNIDENILYALLTTETYKHGARSLEFFILMSPLFGQRRWLSSLLPPRSQMDLHVDAEEFSSKISVLAMCKELAKISHQMYVETELAKDPGKTLHAVKLWGDLEETYRQSNISQIQFHIERFHDSDIGIRQKNWPFQEFSFKEEDLLILSKAEHERWSEERQQNGWVYGENRDNDKKVHNNLVPWEKLSEDDKQKDRDVINKIPILFNKIGLELYYKN